MSNDAPNPLGNAKLVSNSELSVATVDPSVPIILRNRSDEAVDGVGRVPPSDLSSEVSAAKTASAKSNPAGHSARSIEHTSPNPSVSQDSGHGGGITSPGQNPDGMHAVHEKILDVLTKMHAKMEEEQDEGPRRRREPGVTGRSTFFGLPKQRFEKGLGDEDYEGMFPEDKYGEETGPNARVFKVYNEEATSYDIDMIGQAGDSSDVLLVFAGLFSAVLTTFVAQTSQALQTDNSAISNSILLEIAELQRAQENGTSLGNVERAITETTPSSNDVWVNGLWFTSLTLSLATALFAVLTKQWLRQYMISTSGTIRDRCLIRHFRFIGMQQWHVITIIGVLPILLHLALGVFLAGLVVFLIPRCLPLAYIIGTMAVIISLLYFITNLLPVINIQCPYRTPFSEILNVLSYQFGVVIQLICVLYIRVLKAARDCLHRVLPRARNTETVPEAEAEHKVTVFKTLRHLEHDHVQQDSITGYLSLNVIAWLIETSSNPSVHSVALQAIGGLSPSQLNGARNLASRNQTFIPTLVKECTSVSNEGNPTFPLVRSSGKFERLARVWPMFISHTRNDMAYLYPIFRDLDDVEGMVSSLPCCPTANGPNPDIPTLITRLIDDLPDIKLPSSAWSNLLSEVARGWSPREFKYAVCKKALESTYWMSSSYHDDQTARIDISTALSRRPDLLVQIFGDYDLFSSPASSSDTVTRPFSRAYYSYRPPIADYASSVASSSVGTLPSPLPVHSSLSVYPSPSPDSPHLHALLSLHQFLADNKPDGFISLLHSLWKQLHSNLLGDLPTLNDCSAVFYAANHSFVQLKEIGHPLSLGNSRCCETILETCSLAFSHARDRFGCQVSSWRWGCLERVADITLTQIYYKFDGLSSTRRYAQNLWELALEHDVPQAYATCIDVNIFHHAVGWFKGLSLSWAFSTGLLRQLRNKNHSQSVDSEILARCIAYIHQPNNIHMACIAFALLSRGMIKQHITSLARLQPDNEGWSRCRESLRSHCGQSNCVLKVALVVLDSFFEDRHARKGMHYHINPMALVRQKRGRSDLDVELQQVPGGAAPTLSSGQHDPPAYPLHWHLETDDSRPTDLPPAKPEMEEVPDVPEEA